MTIANKVDTKIQYFPFLGCIFGPGIVPVFQPNLLQFPLLFPLKIKTDTCLATLT